MTPRHEHARYLRLLERHLDGELAPAERDTLFDHLEFCDECRATLEAEERLLARLRSVPKLIAPSTLRSNIIHQAMREQHERRTPLITDPRFASILDAVAAQMDSGGASLSESEKNGIPTFAGVRQPHRSRVRRTWRLASPYVAYIFMGIAALAALYTGNLRGIPLARELQTGIRSAVAYFSGSEKAESTVASTQAVRSAAPASRLIPAEDSTADSAIRNAAPAAMATRFTAELHSRLALARETISALARAADGNYPEPAELSGATLAAIVLRPTDPATRLGFEQDELGAALAQLSHEARPKANELNDAAVAEPNAHSGNQFAYDGHRYRTYRLRVSQQRLDRMVHALEKYRVPADDSVLQVLSNQNRVQFTTKRGQVAFFSSEGSQLREAFQENARNAAESEPAPSVQIIVVE
ncbi:MAG: anti-sigma factor family protein [Candidatus Sumerlaeaceae bacterium]